MQQCVECCDMLKYAFKLPLWLLCVFLFFYIYISWIFHVEGKTASLCCCLSPTYRDLFAIKMAVERKRTKKHVTAIDSWLSSNGWLYGFMATFIPLAVRGWMRWAGPAFYSESCRVVALCILCDIRGATQLRAFALKAAQHSSYLDSWGQTHRSTPDWLVWTGGGGFNLLRWGEVYPVVDWTEDLFQYGKSSFGAKFQNPKVNPSVYKPIIRPICVQM